MKQKISFIQLGLVSLALFAISLIFGAADTFAAERVWTGDGSDNNLATAANWQGGVAPVDGDSLVFNDSNTLEVNNNLAGSVTINGITKSSNSVSIHGNSLSIAGTLSGTILFYVPVVISDSVTILHYAGFQESISGSAGITLDSAYDPGAYQSAQVYFHADNSGFTGSLTAINGSFTGFHPGGFGSGVAPLSITNGTVVFCVSKTQDTVIGRSAVFEEEVSIVTIACDYDQSKQVRKVILSGDVTVQGTAIFQGYADLRLTGSLTGGITLSSTSTADLILPDGQVITTPARTVTVTDQGDCPSGSIRAIDRFYINANCPHAGNSISVYGFLGGSGFMGNIYVRSGGIIGPGNSPGTLSTSSLTFDEGGIYEFEVAGAGQGEYDRINVTGTVTLGNGTLRVVPLNNFQPRAGQSFIIISNDGSDAVNGTFAGLAEGATVSVGGRAMFTISYKGGDGNDVVLTALPSGPGKTGSQPASIGLGYQIAAGAAVAAVLFTAAKRKLTKKR